MAEEFEEVLSRLRQENRDLFEPDALEPPLDPSIPVDEIPIHNPKVSHARTTERIPLNRA